MTQLVNGLHFRNIRGDIYGGVTAAVVALPLALAFGVASGAGAIYGMYGAIIVGFFAAIFGGTPSQVSGPTGPMTVVMTAIILQYMAHDPETGLATAFTVVILGGLIQIAMGVLKLGRYIDFVPYPVLSGFMSGIGVIIIILQLAPLVGQVTTTDGILAAFSNLPGLLSNPIIDATILGILTLIIVWFWPARFNKLIPGSLLALIVGTVVYLLFFEAGGNVKIIGDIPTGAPEFHLPTYSPELLIDMLKSAFVLALLGAIDSLLTSLVADNKTRTIHNSDRELIGQGIGNTVAGFFWGLPGAGATMRTVVNVRAGGRTPISGGLHSVILLAIVLGLGSLAESIPHAVLAGILIKVGYDIIDWDYVKRLTTAPRIDVLIMIAVLLITVFIDLITAVGVGVVASCLILVNRLHGLQVGNINLIRSPGEETPLTDEEAEIMKAADGRVLLFHLTGPISFGAAREMGKQLANIDDYDMLVLDLTDVHLIDTTSCKAIEDIILTHVESDRDIYLCGFDDEVYKIMQRLDILRPMDKQHVLYTREAALRSVALKLQAEA
ncbi:MAG: SulP family inorganic anion transporter [Gammaproteobacteria bacterium]